MRKTIAIIGATGNMGKGLATSLSKGPYRLLLFDHEPVDAQALAEDLKGKNSGAEIEARGFSGSADWQADVIIPAIPYGAQRDVAQKIRAASKGKIVVSLVNPMNDTYTAMATESSAAEELQKLLPEAKVVKAFNTTFAATFYEPAIKGMPVDCFLAGDDQEAVKAVSDLARGIGFNPVLAGGLNMSRTLELMQFMLIQITMRDELNWKSGWKLLHNA